jgi:hypothetical protein
MSDEDHVAFLLWQQSNGTGEFPICSGIKGLKEGLVDLRGGFFGVIVRAIRPGASRPSPHQSFASADRRFPPHVVFVPNDFRALDPQHASVPDDSLHLTVRHGAMGSCSGCVSGFRVGATG